MIHIIGLGPGDPNLLTREAWDLLQRAPRVHLRTRRHPTVAGLPTGVKLSAFDALYARAENFEEVYDAIATKIVTAAKRGAKKGEDVFYAVPGHPLVGERSVRLILERAAAAGVQVRIVSGLSFVEPVLEALATHGRLAANDDPMARLQLSDALDLAQLHHPPLDPDRPALVAQIFSRAIASDVKLTLLNQYPPAHEVIVVRAAGSSSLAACDAMPLAELDHGEHFDHLTSLYIPALSGVTSFEGFQETIAHLRAPEGCPWDREQTHQSLRETMLEECYEVLTALDEDDMDALREELGDLLLNLVMQVQIATEEEVFRMTDVIADVDAKLKRRHPHVFGAEHFKDSAEVLVNWHAIKAAEKAAKAGQGRVVVDESALAGIAPALPALAQAQKYAHRAHRAGFRWEDREKRLHKVLEELEEVRSARDDAHRHEEFGDLIFSIAYWADGYKIDIETASRDANQKFARRFRALESTAREQGRAMSEMSEADLLEIWRTVKRAEQQ